jgi:CHASE3 domain sensor protein
VRRVIAQRGLVQELQNSHRTSVLTLCAMLLVSLASSSYLLLVSQPAVAHYMDSVRDARLMHEAMLDQETGLRGWLATGNPAFLEPTIEGRKRETELARTILERAGDDRDATADLLPALVAQHEWDEWADRAANWHVSR